jgi:hypothetical protein
MPTQPPGNEPHHQAAFDINLFLAGPIAILYWILKDLD